MHPPPIPLPLYVCNVNIFLKYRWSLSPYPSFPIQSPSTMTMTEGQGDEQRDNPCLNDIFTNFFTLTLYTKRGRGQRGMGRGRSQPFLWYICQFLNHIKLLNTEEQVGKMEGSNPSPPHKSVVTSPYPSISASPYPFCVKCHSEEIGKYIIKPWIIPLPFTLLFPLLPLRPLPVPLPIDASWSQPRGRGWLSWGDWFISLSLSFSFPSLPPLHHHLSLQV